MTFAIRELLRREDRLLGFLCVFLQVHDRVRVTPGLKTRPTLKTGPTLKTRPASEDLPCLCLPERLVVLALILGQRAGELHVDRRVEIPACVPPDNRHPVTLQTKPLPWLRLFGILETHGAGERGDLRLAAEHRR